MIKTHNPVKKNRTAWSIYSVIYANGPAIIVVKNLVAQEVTIFWAKIIRLGEIIFLVNPFVKVVP